MARTPTADVAEDVTPAPAKQTDEELLAQLQREFANRPPRERRISIETLYNQGVALVAAATGRRFPGGIPRVSEQTAVKLYELTLMWALNNRGDQPSHDILPEEAAGEVDEGAVEAPTFDEIITGSDDQSEPGE